MLARNALRLCLAAGFWLVVASLSAQDSVNSGGIFATAGQLYPVQEPAPLDFEQRLRQLELNQQRLDRGMGLPSDLGTQAEQNAPGADDAIPRDEVNLPDYVFAPEYYLRPIGGGHALADYAPAGYEARDQQDGPGVPEYVRVGPPPRLDEAQLDNFVTRGMHPGAFLVPGTTTSFRLRGFVRLTGLFDFDPVGVPDAFVTNSIPVPQQFGQNFNVSARISRFALESWTPTNFCDWTIHTLVEGDFFNGPGQAAGGGGNPFRLRHAFLDFGYFRFGQQNSVFMDGTNWPSLVDFQGPNSWVNQRQPLVRMTLPMSERWFWATSMERPFSDITAVDGAGASLGANVQDVPDFATHLRFEADRGHLQVSGLLRQIGFRPTGGDVTRQTAAAISGNLVFHPWALMCCTNPVRDENPSGLTRSRILLQGTWGPGVGRYINDLAGQGFDGQVDPVTGDFNLVEATGWNASYEHWFNEHWLTNFTYANVDVDNNPGLPGSTYDSAEYIAVSLWWVPLPRLSFGFEVLSGERENLDGDVGEADRINALAQYNF